MLTLQEDLAESIANWELLGHPALLERFVYRQGKAFTPRKRIGRKGEAKACFSNAAKFVMKNPRMSYVEGFARNKEMNWKFHHAWVSTNGTDAMDTTLDAEEYDYFGIAYTVREVTAHLREHGYYGLFDSGLGLNTKLMFATDPDLERICKEVHDNRALAKEKLLNKLMEGN